MAPPNADRLQQSNRGAVLLLSLYWMLKAIGKGYLIFFRDIFDSLLRWKGSIYKFVLPQLLLYYLIYFCVTLSYLCSSDNQWKRFFEASAKYFSSYTPTFDMVIMLGLFTFTTLHRLYTMETTMPGIAKLTTCFMMSLKPGIPNGENVVKRYARLAILGWVLSIGNVSKDIRKENSRMDYLIKQGILTKGEKKILEEEAVNKTNRSSQALVIIDRMLLLLKKCSKEKLFNNEHADYDKNIELLMTHKKACGNIIKFATKNVPHALIQAVVVAVYFYGITTILAHDLNQFIAIKKENTSEAICGDIVAMLTPSDGGDEAERIRVTKLIVSLFPIMPLMQVSIFLTWFTLGILAINPFGDSDTNIDLKALLEDHIKDYERLPSLYTRELDDDDFQIPVTSADAQPNSHDSSDETSPALHII